MEVGRAKWVPVLLLCASIAAGQERVSVTSIRTWPLDGVTRIAIETSGPPQWRAELIENPYRLFIDVSNSRIALKKGEDRTISVVGPMVEKARIAMNQPTVARVVLDLKQKVDYNISVLANPYRIMVELRPAAGHIAAPESAPPLTSTAPTPTPLPPPIETSKASRPAPVPPAPSQTQPPRAEPKPADSTETAAANSPAVVLAKPPKPATVNHVTGERSLTRVLGLKLGRVVLDPGHGGEDYGTTGISGLHEKDLVLDVAKRLGALIESRMGAEVIYTRSEDVFIPLQERTAIANRARADLFLSIHANSSRIRDIAGPETFFLSLNATKAELEVASRENAANGQSIFELEGMLKQIARQDKVQESNDFADRIQQSLFSEVRKGNKSARNRGVKKAPFVVLVGAKMPSVLAEIGFLSHRREEGLLKRGDYRQRIAEALYRGVEQYASTLSQMEVARTGSETATHP